MKRQVFFAVGLVMGAIWLAVWQAPGQGTKIVACDVGQGDGLLIIKGSKQVVVDGGPSGEKMLACLTRHVPFYDRTIELVVLTHADFDHINGLAPVVERYEIGQMVTADGINEGSALARLRAALSQKGVEVAAVEQGDVLKVGERDSLVFRVLWPKEVDERRVAQAYGMTEEAILGTSDTDTNERSVVLLLDEGGYLALLTGDLGERSERELLTSGRLGEVDYLKVGHHGSKYSTTSEFLTATKPQLAVISAGENNRYGHPANEVLARLEAVGAVIRRTDQEGDVVVEWE